MNPLSAIRLPMSPEMMQGAGFKLSPDLAAPSIPQYELGKLAPATPLQPSTGAAPAIGGFESTLGRLVGGVLEKQAAASAATADFAMGGTTSLHQVMTAGEEASVGFQLMVEVRNKLLESYQELMRMQV